MCPSPIPQLRRLRRSRQSQKTKATRFPKRKPSPRPSRPVAEDSTPDVIDGARFLGMSQKEGMRELGITSEAAYERAYRDIEQVVSRRDNRAAQYGRSVSIVVKRSGVRINDA